MWAGGVYLLCLYVCLGFFVFFVLFLFLCLFVFNNLDCVCIFFLYFLFVLFICFLNLSKENDFLHQKFGFSLVISLFCSCRL